MNRITVISALAAVAIATPLAAQGHSGRQTRNYIDARGRECRETTQAKRNGDSKYEVKCKGVKHHKGSKHRDHDDDHYDRSSSDQRCANVFGVRRCDVVSSRSYPSTLPDMASAVIWGRGRRLSSATDWLGGTDYRVRYVDRDRNGRPESASWLGGDGRIAQEWIDSNGDGRADAVRIFRDGRLMRVLRG